MAVSESQLQTWTNAPGTTKPQYTNEQIRKALSHSSIPQVRNCEVYLQGSYANSTNIKADSDVDVIAQLNSTFSPNLLKLSEFEKSVFNLTYSDATYQWADFRSDVISALTAFFGSGAIKLGNKSIKLAGNDQRLNADIIPCLQHRKYRSFSLDNRMDYIEGMKFWTIRENKKIINYPKVHRNNGEDKNGEHRTDQMYKNLVRIFKNIKRRLVEDSGLNSQTGPSYFIECSIYNVLDSYFQNNYQDALENILEFILRKCDPNKLVTVSHQHLLFGSEPWQWNIPDANNFFQAVEEFYNNSQL